MEAQARATAAPASDHERIATAFHEEAKSWRDLKKTVVGAWTLAHCEERAAECDRMAEMHERAARA